MQTKHFVFTKENFYLDGHWTMTVVTIRIFRRTLVIELS